MTIEEVYEQYKIMPNLRLHQLRVAAIARMMAHALGADTDLVTRAALLHDIGNIMKSDLSHFPPEFYGDKDMSYWQGVKDECGKKYGEDEHDATLAMMRELHMDDASMELVRNMGFSKAPEIRAQGSLELKILEYADQRVAPYGIVSMEERLKDGRERYKSRDKAGYTRDDTAFERNAALLRALENELFATLYISPESLTDESLKNEIETLRTYTIGADDRD